MAQIEFQHQFAIYSLRTINTIGFLKVVWHSDNSTGQASPCCHIPIHTTNVGADDCTHHIVSGVAHFATPSARLSPRATGGLRPERACRGQPPREPSSENVQHPATH